MLSPTRFADVDGHRIAYHRAGQGETVVLVHGITTYSFIWEDIAQLLRPDFDVITIDLLGCGESDMPLDESYSISAHADRLHTFVNGLGIERFHLVGHDLGGGIAQIYAVRHPEMLLDVTVVNTVAYDFWPVQPITALRAPVIRELLMATFDLGTFKLVIKRGVYHKARVTNELMARFASPLSTVEGRQAFMHFARCLDNHNLTDIAGDLRALTVPMLIVRGDADPYLSASIAEKLHAEVPGSRLERIATASHFIQVDEPEWLTERIRAFIGEHRG